MRLVAWNIQQGAPTRGARIVDALLAHEPSLIVLTEYHPARSEPIANALRLAGLQHQASSPAGSGFEVFMASKDPLQGPSPLVTALPLAGGYLEVEVPDQALIAAGVYVP